MVESNPAWTEAIALLSPEQAKIILIAIDAPVQFKREIKGFGVDVQWIGLEMENNRYVPTHLHIDGGRGDLDLVLNRSETIAFRHLVEQHLESFNNG